MILTVKKNLGFVVVILSSFCLMHAVKPDYIEDDYTLIDSHNGGRKYARSKHSKSSLALKRFAQGYNGEDSSPNGRDRNKKKACAAAVMQAESARIDFDDCGSESTEPQEHSFSNKRGEANIAVKVYDDHNILKQAQQCIKGIVQALGVDLESTVQIFSRKHATILYTGKTATHEIEGIKKAIEDGIESFRLRSHAQKPIYITIGGGVQIYGAPCGAGKKFLGVPAMLDDHGNELLQSIVDHMPDGYKRACRNLHVSLGTVEVSSNAQAQKLARLVFDAQVVAIPFSNIVNKVILMPSQGRQDVYYSIRSRTKPSVQEPFGVNFMDLEAFGENHAGKPFESFVDFGDRTTGLWEAAEADVATGFMQIAE